MIDNCIAIVTPHYQKSLLGYLQLLPIFNLTYLLVTILGDDFRADHDDETPKYKDLYRHYRIMCLFHNNEFKPALRHLERLQVIRSVLIK
jgi:hypothetical protein